MAHSVVLGSLDGVVHAVEDLVDKTGGGEFARVAVVRVECKFITKELDVKIDIDLVVSFLELDLGANLVHAGAVDGPPVPDGLSGSVPANTKKKLSQTTELLYIFLLIKNRS